MSSGSYDPLLYDSVPIKLFPKIVHICSNGTLDGEGNACSAERPTPQLVLPTPSDRCGLYLIFVNLRKTT